MQRLLPVAAGGRTLGKRHQADIQLGGRRRHEPQQCVGQLTGVVAMRDLGP
jgi:hypothetical protein